MKTHLDIYGLKKAQEHDKHGENCEKHHFHPHF